jgi:hypothetical protein
VPKAKRVIYLYQAGGPSHLEMFDYKPALAKLEGQAMPESFTKGQQLAQLQGKALRLDSFQRMAIDTRAFDNILTLAVGQP